MARAESVAGAVVGAGQAGLATSCELTRVGVEHVVLERGRIGQTWRDRWDSFCLVTPNWSVQLPDGHYDGPDPDGFMLRDELVRFFERYAAKIGVHFLRKRKSSLLIGVGEDAAIIASRIAASA
jgi:putative flavoprotein involved in K+ transport